MNQINDAFKPINRKALAVLQRFAMHQVEYLVIGGYAVRYHGYLRPVKDVDLFFNRSELNVAKICEAFAEVGPKLNIASLHAHLTQPCSQLAWVSLDMFSSLGDFSFDEFYASRVSETYRGIPLNVIDKKNLIQSKLYALTNPKREPAKDIEDLKRLGHPLGQ